MPFGFGIDTVLSNIGMSFEWLVILILVLANLAFFAKDFKLGMITLLGSMSGLFIWFYNSGYNYALPLVIVFMSIIILAISLFAVQDTSTTGGFN